MAKPEGPAVAVVVGGYPERSETFVRREVEGLRAAGVRVTVAGLRPPGSPPEDVRAADLLVYGPGTLRTVGAALAEMARHPFRSLRSLGTGISDLLRPGEPVPLRERLKLPLQVFAGIGLGRRLRARGVRHLHCHFAHAPTTLGMVAARQIGAPFSFTGHANDIFQRRAFLRRKLERAAFVSAISRWHADFYREVAPGVRRVAIVRCGVDTRDWTPAGSDDEPGRPLRLISVGRLVEKKGVDLLLRALPELVAANEVRSLTIVGEGPMGPAWRKLVDELGVSEAVEWAGARSVSEVRERMRRSDVFVLPCRTDRHGDRDGLPVVLMEAMACGLVAVSGDLPAIRELVADGETGCLVPSEDPAAIATAISGLARDAGRRRRLAAAGRARVCEEFDLERNVGRLLTAIGRS